jgi:hypothetical protein
MATSNRGASAADGFDAAAAFVVAGAFDAPWGDAETAASAPNAAHAAACNRSVGLRFIASLLSVHHRKSASSDLQRQTPERRILSVECNAPILRRESLLR